MGTSFRSYISGEESPWLKHGSLKINSESSPYEAEDDFFTRSQDDSSLSVNLKRSTPDSIGRRRGQSESVVSRPPSAAEALRT